MGTAIRCRCDAVIGRLAAGESLTMNSKAGELRRFICDCGVQTQVQVVEPQRAR